MWVFGGDCGGVEAVDVFSNSSSSFDLGFEARPSLIVLGIEAWRYQWGTSS